jgi:hypothetical protein
VKPGETLARGQRYGFIRFGSRVDVYVAPDARPKVAIGDAVFATETVLAEFRPADALLRRRPGNHGRVTRVCATFAAEMADFDTQRSLQKNRIRRRGIYLLPNLFTTAALFAGFYATVQAMNLSFDQAAVAIFVAMVLDGLDGRVARADENAKRVRRRVRQPRRHGELRRCASP